MKLASSTQLWYMRPSAGRYVFRWDHLLDEGLAFVQAGVPSCLDNGTLRSCANFKCDVADVNKYIRTDFRSVKSVSGECYQPYRVNTSWYIRSDCLVQQIFNQSPPVAYFQQFTGSCYSLWITGNSLWHRDCPGHAVDWCQLYFQGEYIFYVLINIFFNQKIFHFNFYNIFICTTCKHFTLWLFWPRIFCIGVMFNSKYFQRDIFCRSRAILSKQGVSTTIKHSPSCYNTSSPLATL